MKRTIAILTAFIILALAIMVVIRACSPNPPPIVITTPAAWTPRPSFTPTLTPATTVIGYEKIIND